MSGEAQLHNLSERLRAATDQEHWQEAATLLAEIGQTLQSPAASHFDKKTLENTLAAVQSALQDTQRRRDEIGVLVRALGGPPKKPTDVST